MNKKKFVNVFIGLLAFLTVSLGVLFAINRIEAEKYNPIVAKKLSDFIRVNTKGLYDVKYSAIRLHLLESRVRLKDLVIERTSKPSLENPSATAFDAHITDVDIHFHSLLKCLFSGDPITVEQIQLNHGFIHLSNKIPGKSFDLLAKNIHLNAGPLPYLPDGSSPSAAAKFIQTLAYTLSADHLQYQTDSGTIRIYSKRLVYNNLHQTVHLDSLKATQIKGNSSRVVVTVPLMDLTGFSLTNLIETDSLKTGKVSAFNFDVHYEDFKGTSKGVKKLMPQALLKSINHYFRIDSIELKNGRVAYEAENESTGQKGRIAFDRIGGLMKHITNDPLLIKKYPRLDICLSSFFYDQGHLQTSFSFLMNSPNDSFYVKGTMDRFPIKFINQITVPLKNLRINQGMVRKFDFRILGDEFKSEGQMKMMYNNLSLRILAGDDDSSQMKAVKVLSKFANTFIILNDNPLRGEPVRTAEMFYIRDADKSIFNYLWKSLLSGFKPTVGIVEGREDRLVAFLAKYKKFQKWRLEGKSDRKKNRFERREKRRIRRNNRALLQ